MVRRQGQFACRQTAERTTSACRRTVGWRSKIDLLMLRAFAGLADGASACFARVLTIHIAYEASCSAGRGWALLAASAAAPSGVDADAVRPPLVRPPSQEKESEATGRRCIESSRATYSTTLRHHRVMILPSP